MSRLLMRDTQRGVLGGVAAGFGDYLQVDPVLVRIGFALLAFAHGIGFLLYAVCWVLMPTRQAVAAPAAPAPEESPYPAATSTNADVAAAQLAIGAVLVVVGAMLLGHNLDWFHWPRWLRFDTLWPLLLVALGLGLMARSRRSSV